MFFKKYLHSLFVTTFFIITSASAQTRIPANLQALISESLSNNPQLKVLQNAIYMHRSQIPISGALPDPVLGLSLMNIPANRFAFNQQTMTGKQISLMQKFLFPGKLRLKSSIARQEADISAANYMEIKNLLIKQVKTTYYNLFYLDQALETTKRNRSLLGEFVKIATAKYVVGKGQQQDVLKAQVELARLSERRLVLGQKRQTVQAQMNRLLNRNIGTPIGATSLPPLPNFSSLSDKGLLYQARQKRPLIKAWQKRLQQSKAKIALARKSYWPDFTLSLAYMQRNPLVNGMGGQDIVSMGLSFNLPIFARSKQNKQMEAATFASSQTEAGFKEVLNQISETLDNTLSALERSRRQEVLYRTSILPQARQSLESAMAGYQNDKVDFLTLINNQMTLFNVELDYQRVMSDYFKSLAELEYVVGGLK